MIVTNNDNIDINDNVNTNYNIDDDKYDDYNIHYTL